MMRLLMAVLLLAAALPQTPAAPPAREPAMAPKVTGALAGSNLRHERLEPGMWMVSFTGKHIRALSVYIFASVDGVVLAAHVASSSTLSPDDLRTVLRTSFDAPFVKLGINPSGDLVAKMELGRDFSAGGFRENVEWVATVADSTAARLSGGAKPLASAAQGIQPGAGATLSILRGVFELAYDPAKWRQDPAAELGGLALVHRSGESQVKILADRLQITGGGMREIVMGNARGMATDVVLTAETPRTVNGLPVTILRYDATATGIKFTFYNQVFSDSSGNVQLAAWTGANLFDEYERDFLELFAGFRKVR